MTTRAASVVWVSDEPILDATLRVYADPEGTTDIGSTLQIELESARFPGALDRGVARVDVSGLERDACVYVQTETRTASGTLLLPASSPLLELCTESTTLGLDVLGRPIANALLQLELLDPDGSPADPGTLVLVAAPGLARHALAAFVGDGIPAPAALVNLNNFFDRSSSDRASVLAGDPIDIVEFRGLRCPGLADHQLLRLRLAPGEEASTPTQVARVLTPQRCGASDTVCDGGVDILDGQRVLNRLGAFAGDCAFHPDLDVVPDLQIDAQDAQQVLSEIEGG